MASPDMKGGSDVRLTFEQALDVIKQTDHLSLGVPKIIYLVGWQYNGHDDKYPAFFEVNRHLKRSSDATAEESLQWLIREARKYHTTVSLHINMTDAYDNSPLWDEYVEKDLISKNSDGKLKVIGEYNQHKAYQINYKNEWEKGYTQQRIDRLLALLPELKESATIHIDAWIARPSEGHNETQIVEAAYQKKALQYWKAKGIDVTSEWVMDYMTGDVPLAWHFNSFSQEQYLSIPAHIYTGVGINPDITDSDFGLGFLFGTTCYGEPFWKAPFWGEASTWQQTLTKDFMLKCPQYFFLNRYERLSVEGSGKERTAYYSGDVNVSLSDSTVRQGDRIWRNKNVISIPAVWRDDKGLIVYSADEAGKFKPDIPYSWDKAKRATIYKVTSEGLKEIKKVAIQQFHFVIDVEKDTPYYIIPEA
jgi:hypothetical protein